MASEHRDTTINNKTVLGQCVNSLRDTILHNTIIDTNISHILSEDSTSSRSLDYDVKVVDNYSDLYKSFNLDSALTVNSSPASASAELKIFNSLKLNSHDVFIVIKSEIIDKTEHFIKASMLKDNNYAEEAKNFHQFISSYGDKYISEVQIGKKIIAVIQFSTIQNEAKDALQSALKVKINNLGAVPVGADAKLELERANQTIERHQISTIKLHIKGTKLEDPNIDIDIKGLYQYLNKFSLPENDDFTIIRYKTDPYCVALHTPEAVRLEDNQIIVRELLTLIDMSVNKLRFIINTISLVKDKFFDEGKADVSISDLKAWLDEASKIENKLKDMIKKIEFKYDWTEELKIEKINEIRSFDKNISELQEKAQKLPVPNELLMNIRVEGAARIHYAKKATNKFYLNHRGGIGSFTELMWKIVPNPNITDNSAVEFDVKIKKSHNKTYHTLFKNVKDNDVTSGQEISPFDKLIIANPSHNNHQPFNVKIYMKK